jgi:UDP-N-acetylmuramoylalanine--D-glutamate ligase
MRRGDDAPRAVLALEDMPLDGAPNVLNACAALALVEPFGLDDAVLAEGLRTFAGLPHRQQTVARGGGVIFVNDTKATNVHAVCSGLAGYAGDVVIILGGSGKGEDYAPLREALGPVKHVVLIGVEGPRIGAALGDAVSMEYAGDMADAVDRAATATDGRGTVLLSPACASFDMFRDYGHRGEVFAAAARAWVAARMEAMP